MTIGTRSVLYGAHAFWLHPFSVLLAWRRLYGSWLGWRELVAIALHDVGYWGKPNLDGPEGKEHPWLGAIWVAKIIMLVDWRRWLCRKTLLNCSPHFWFAAQEVVAWVACHSRDFAQQYSMPVSALYAPDKLAIFYDPAWFYLWRTRLSGELAEFRQRAIAAGHITEAATDQQWLAFYKANVLARPEIAALLNK